MKRMRLDNIQEKRVKKAKVDEKLNLPAVVKLERLHSTEYAVITITELLNEVTIRNVVRDASNNSVIIDYAEWTIPILVDKNRSTKIIGISNFGSKQWAKPISSAVCARDIYNQTIYLPLILDVLKGYPIEQILLDCYFQILMDQRFGKNVDNPPAVVYVPMQFFPYDLKGEGWDKRRKEPDMDYGPQYNVHDKSLVIAPMYAFNHFYLAYYDFRMKQVDIMDPLWDCLDKVGKTKKRGIRIEQVMRQLKHLVIKFSDLDLGYLDNWSIRMCDDWQEQRGFTCGIQVVAYAESILKGDKVEEEVGMKSKEIMDEKTLKSIQQKVAIEILKTSDFGRELLKYICK